MLHALLMTLARAKRASQFCKVCLALIVAAFPLVGGAGRAADRPRVVSINMCTDQLVLALADTPQILGLSPYTRDRMRSWAATPHSPVRGCLAARDVVALIVGRDPDSLDESGVWRAAIESCAENFPTASPRRCSDSRCRACLESSPTRRSLPPIR